MIQLIIHGRRERWRPQLTEQSICTHSCPFFISPHIKFSAVTSRHCKLVIDPFLSYDIGKKIWIGLPFAASGQGKTEEHTSTSDPGNRSFISPRLKLTFSVRSRSPVRTVRGVIATESTETWSSCWNGNPDTLRRKDSRRSVRHPSKQITYIQSH
jgi:hypothetical protein